MEKLRKIKVFIVDDCVRDVQLLKMHLEKIPNFEIVLVAKNGRELLKEVRTITPDVILMDIRMDIMDRIEATMEIRKLNKDIKVLACTGMSDENSVIRMVQAGCNGYLDKDSTVEDYDKAINIVMKEGIYFNDLMTKSIYKKAMDQMFSNKNIFGNLFNEMEIKVGRCLSRGLGFKQTGDEVDRSETSIPKYKSDILKKIGSENDIDIVRYFLKHKLILPSEL